MLWSHLVCFGSAHLTCSIIWILAKKREPESKSIRLGVGGKVWGGEGGMRGRRRDLPTALPQAGEVGLKSNLASGSQPS